MRPTFLAALSFAALLSAADHAHAQLAVIDAPGDASLVQQVATAAKQLTSLQQQYNELVSTYQQVSSQYKMLTQFANPNGVAQELEQPFLQNPLPSVSSLASSLTGSSGSASSSYTQQYLDANRIYTPPSTSQGGQLMNTQANALASIEGLATSNLDAIQQRIAGLSDLQSQLDSATTIQEVTSVNARMGAEQNYISAQEAQAANLQTITEAQVAAQAQAHQQMVSQQAAQAAAQFPVSVP
jgi:hypothetical protein